MCEDKAIDSDCEASDETMHRSIRDSINDSGIDIDAETVFDRIEEHHAKRISTSDQVR